jgi:hypothetical protein
MLHGQPHLVQCHHHPSVHCLPFITLLIIRDTVAPLFLLQHLRSPTCMPRPSFMDILLERQLQPLLIHVSCFSHGRLVLVWMASTTMCCYFKTSLVKRNWRISNLWNFSTFTLLPPLWNIIILRFPWCTLEHSSYSKNLWKYKNNYDILKIYMIIKHVVTK